MMLGFFFVFFFQTVKNSFEKNYARSIGALNSKGSSVAVEDVFKDKQEIKKKKKNTTNVNIVLLCSIVFPST